MGKSKQLSPNFHNLIGAENIDGIGNRRIS